jgi:hypothetical protein
LKNNLNLRVPPSPGTIEKGNEKQSSILSFGKLQSQRSIPQSEISLRSDEMVSHQNALK